ncbi:MAG: hypothetical protein ABIJ95_11615 [Pseudomonadota bacterium]
MESSHLVSPTGKGLRDDPGGRGHYRAPRGARWHDGMDFLCEPGQVVVAPISGKVAGRSRPYDKGPYDGLVIEGDRLAVKLFYVAPDRGVVGRTVRQGEPVGRAQDISARYGGGMLAHVHLRIHSADPALFLEAVHGD